MFVITLVVLRFICTNREFITKLLVDVYVGFFYNGIIGAMALSYINYCLLGYASIQLGLADDDSAVIGQGAAIYFCLLVYIIWIAYVIQRDT